MSSEWLILAEMDWYNAIQDYVLWYATLLVQARETPNEVSSEDQYHKFPCKKILKRFSPFLYCGKQVG